MRPEGERHHITELQKKNGTVWRCNECRTHFGTKKAAIEHAEWGFELSASDFVLDPRSMRKKRELREVRESLDWILGATS